MSFTKKFFQDAGRRGGNATLEKHGVEHFKNIPSKKTKKSRRMKKQDIEPNN